MQDYDTTQTANKPIMALADVFGKEVIGSGLWFL
jgi:hypothetical protein